MRRRKSEAELEQDEADAKLDEWGTERSRIRAGGYPSGNDSDVSGAQYSDRTFATVSRLSHLLRIDNIVTSLPVEQQRVLESWYVIRGDRWTERKAARECGMALRTWQRVRHRARRDFLREYKRRKIGIDTGASKE